MYSFSYLEPVCCSMFSSNCCFLTRIQVSQEAGQVVWYAHLFQNFLQFIVIHTVKGVGIVNKAEIDVFLELSCFFNDPANVGNLISGSSAFSKISFMTQIIMMVWSLTSDHIPDILECEVKWALGSITMNKASGGDGIPVELFQILKDNAVKVLNMSANLENSAMATGLEKVSFHSNPKEKQCQRMLKLPHTCSHLSC